MAKTKTCLLYPPKAPLGGKSDCNPSSYRAGECVIRLLSLDIFSIIASFLSTEDIRCARLSGRELHFFLSPYLIRSINLTTFKSNNLKKKPELFHNLKNLCLDLHRYPVPTIHYHPKSFRAYAVFFPHFLTQICFSFPQMLWICTLE